MKNKTSLFILLILLVIAFVLTASIYGIRDFGDSSNTDESNPLLEWIEKMDTTDKDFTEYAGDYPEDEFIITDDTEEHSTTEESESETESNTVEDTVSETEEDGRGLDLVVDTDPDKDEDCNGQQLRIAPDQLKMAIFSQQIQVINLKFTKDGRLIDADNTENSVENWEKAFEELWVYMEKLSKSMDFNNEVNEEYIGNLMSKIFNKEFIRLGYADSIYYAEPLSYDFVLDFMILKNTTKGS